MKQLVVAGAIAATLLAACSTPRTDVATPPPSRAKAVLDAQYAAEGRQAPMQSAEANRIYENYLEGIGEEPKKKAEEME